MDAKTLLVGEPLHGTLSYAHDMAFLGVIAVVLVVFHSVNCVVYPVTTGTTNREPPDACGVQPRGFVSLSALYGFELESSSIGPISEHPIFPGRWGWRAIRSDSVPSKGDVTLVAARRR